MGCGGSKQEVATEATISVRRAPGEKPDAGASAVSVEAAQPSPPVPPPAEVKDITINTDGAAAEGIVPVRSSPDEEPEDAVAGGQYYSPRGEPHGEESDSKEIAPPPTTEVAAAAATNDPDGPAGVPVSYGSVAGGSFPMGQTGATVI